MKLDKSVFALHKCIRERYLQYLEGFTLEQLAVIPQGFRNNLLWNISHAIVTQQLYCYYNSGLPMYVPLNNSWKRTTKRDFSPLIPTTSQG